MYLTELTSFIFSHAAWEDILSKEPYNLKISRDGPYIMFKYSQTDSDFSIPLVREARGIIFREDTWECVCHAFNKFGNYGEQYCPDIDWESASVQEKVDGSLMKVWFDNGWHLSTNGTIDAWKAEIGNIKYPSFGKLFEKALEKYDLTWESFTKILGINYTFIFEMVSPYNRVVIDYPDFALYYLGVRYKKSAEEFVSEIFYDFNIPKRFPLHTLEEVQEAATALPWSEEGYVVCDKNFNRVKIKSPAYVRAHYCRNNNVITKKKLMEIILANELEEFLIYANEYKDEIRQLQQILDKLEQTAESIKQSIIVYRGSSRHDFAELVCKYPVRYKGFLFENYDRDVSWKDYTKDWSADKWLRYL